MLQDTTANSDNCYTLTHERTLDEENAADIIESFDDGSGDEYGRFSFHEGSQQQ